MQGIAETRTDLGRERPLVGVWVVTALDEEHELQCGRHVDCKTDLLDEKGAPSMGRQLMGHTTEANF